MSSRVSTLPELPIFPLGVNCWLGDLSVLRAKNPVNKSGKMIAVSKKLLFLARSENMSLKV
jgi:hypothetical protein